MFLEIGIEYDSCRKVRWKSIEKLLCCPANICIVLVSGYESKNNINVQIYRIKKVYNELKTFFDSLKAHKKLNILISKTFWLGLIDHMIFQEVISRE
ncbi:MAG: hypothetical protein GF317_22770 [Candidatus Lokiarchaeota archaeon]|nr:hypothetical protein [Candidatus Lokiarchaeota archaeon]